MPLPKADWLTDVVEAVKGVEEDLGFLNEVQHRRLTDAKDATTGRSNFQTAVTIKAKIEAYDKRDRKISFTPSVTVDTAKHRVTVYEVLVEVGDHLVWGGKNHEVLYVGGLMERASEGTRYNSVCYTD